LALSQFFSLLPEMTPHPGTVPRTIDQESDRLTKQQLTWANMTYDALAPYVKDGSLRLSIVPVGVVEPTAVGRAEALLMAKSGTGAEPG
jgi:hypothetical protein